MIEVYGCNLKMQTRNKTNKEIVLKEPLLLFFLLDGSSYIITSLTKKYSLQLRKISICSFFETKYLEKPTPQLQTHLGYGCNLWYLAILNVQFHCSNKLIWLNVNIYNVLFGNIESSFSNCVVYYYLIIR